MAHLPTEPVQIVEPLRGRNDTRRNLVGLSRDELKMTLTEAGLEPFRARQVWQWIYWHGVTALKIAMDDQGIALSRRRITLSTSGVVPMIPKVGEALDVNLAVSLHAVNDDIRDTLVPINRKWPIKELLEACAAYPGAKNSR